jgi:hypothetical protein
MVGMAMLKTKKDRRDKIFIAFSRLGYSQGENWGDKQPIHEEYNRHG